jgi:hypothetical protein
VVARVFDVGAGVMSDDIVIAGGAMPQEKPVVAALPDGGFVVAWHGYDASGAGDDVDVYFNLCSVTLLPAAGTQPADLDVLCDPAVRANTTTQQAQINPSLAVSSLDGAIILAWEDWSPYGEGFAPWNLSGIRYRMFDSTGEALVGFETDRLANSTTDDVQAEPSVAALSTGEFMIAWSDASEADPLSDRDFGPRGCSASFQPIQLTRPSATQAAALRRRSARGARRGGSAAC